ncbi:putative RNA polymerase II subunit B1 CTD phosphatase rpap2 [Syngnathus acus]|uniref:putative RNA polymerase II subunit B1 CTD phosphatase rpap2 n=1 Tax=Syngnathus acus TaxID=161584 RepID=UPI001886006B|nr:putative RNA polymerase II subunit B1 CTD phosphatase rpap2 [Syngnathus acus]
MESIARRTTSKANKKDGKHAKMLIAEAEARRREAIRETLRERLELEKRALQVVERLLEDSVSDDFLLDCAKFITSANYKDAVEERFITKLCGYPLCSNKLNKIPKQQFKISTQTNKVYDITERKCFCSNFCYRASKEFELQISKTPLWLRQDEGLAEIKLTKGDTGSSGEEVCLTAKCLLEEDIEQPLSSPSEDHQESGFTTGHSDSSDDEREQDFVSSVVSREQRPRVHWGDRPKRKNEGEGVGRVEAERRKVASGRCPRRQKADVAPKNNHREANVEEVTDQLNSCSLHTTSTPPASPIAESTRPSDTDSQNSRDLTELNAGGRPSLNIVQVGMSKRGATGLRSLLKNHTLEAKHSPIGQNLLESLRATLNDWLTAESLQFLHGADCALDSPSTYGKEEEEEEELDEDDIEDDITEGNERMERGRATAPVPDFEALKRETQQMVLKVREFYKGTWIVPEEAERTIGNEDQSTGDSPALPLVDSKAQHLIQKRITVEKLASCLRSIVGPLSLTLSDITSDLNNLVRTFRFTNTNIIHKPPEWTLIAVVLLHLLSCVSPVVAEALKTPSSVSYVNTLTEELGLQQRDLLNLLQAFTPPPR